MTVCRKGINVATTPNGSHCFQLLLHKLEFHLKKNNKTSLGNMAKKEDLVLSRKS